MLIRTPHDSYLTLRRLDAMYNGSTAATAATSAASSVSGTTPIHIKVTVTASPAPCIFNCTMPKEATSPSSLMGNGRCGSIYAPFLL